MLNSSSMEISRSLTSWRKGARSIIHRALQYLEGNLTVIEHFPIKPKPRMNNLAKISLMPFMR